MGRGRPHALAAVALLAVAVAAAPRPARATELGVDMNQPVANGVADLAALAPIGAAKSAWVRVAFNGDSLALYDQLVDGYLREGVQVYGLLNAGLTPASGAYNSDAWQAAFVADATKIIEHYEGRIHVFETFNEPNNYAPGTSSATLDASSFAHLLARLYTAVKIDRASDACLAKDVRLVSGPVLSFDGTTAADYVNATYAAGKSSWGWDDIRAQTGSYPLDGLGYHVYVAQDGPDTATVAGAVATNVDAAYAAMASNEGGATSKLLWVSEFGWRTDLVTEQQQADYLEAGLGALDASGKVALGVWFSLLDFGPTDEWGLYDADLSRAKPSAQRYAALAATHRPAFHAYPTAPSALKVARGSTTHVVVHMTNHGTEAWPAGGDVRLGAGPGCPETSAANALGWVVAPGAGYVNGATDARVFVATEVPPGGGADFALDVVAPDALGPVRLVARMVKEGDAWFGVPLDLAVDVVPPDALGDGDAGSAGGDGGGSGGGAGAGGGSFEPGSDGGGCGCRTAASTTFGGDAACAALLAAAAAFLVRRRRSRRAFPSRPSSRVAKGRERAGAA